MHHYPKSLHAIAKDLRKNGTLDEVKWHDYQCSIRYVIIIYTLFNIACIYLLYHEFTFLIITQVFFLIALYFKFDAINTPLYQLTFCKETCEGKLWLHDDDDNSKNFGHVESLITLFFIALWYIFRPKYHKIFYEYTDPQNGLTIIASVRIQKKYMKHYIHKEGEKITIAYLKDKPQQSVPLITPVLEQYQLQKET